MKKNGTWYGYLQAGKKSSPVVLDTRLVTKSPKTIFLLNYAQGKFLEYSREIVEPKLQELGPDDDLLKELKSAFKAVRKIFVADQDTHKRAIASAISKIKTTGLYAMDNIPNMVLEDTTDSFQEGYYTD